MSDRSPRSLVAYGLALVLIAALGAAWLQREPAPPAGAREALPLRAGEPESGRLTVHVAGAVRNPGVYRLKAGARVDDAVSRAGGTTRRADLAQINLAAKLEDGRQVLVPARAPITGAGLPGAAAPAPGVPLNLNTATLEQLDELDGIGPATAQKILDHRDAQGGFGSVEELAQVPGIGPKRMAGLREQVRV